MFIIFIMYIMFIIFIIFIILIIFIKFIIFIRLTLLISVGCKCTLTLFRSKYLFNDFCVTVNRYLEIFY